MNNKPQKSWGEIQLAIAAVALTATLGFWNMFSAGQKQDVVTPSATDTDVPPPPTQAMAQAPAPTATPGFLPVKIIFGGTAPQQKVVVQVNASQPQPQTKRKAPKPSTNTGSSK